MTMSLREQAAQAQRELDDATRDFQEADQTYQDAKMLGMDSAMHSGEPMCVAPAVLDHELHGHEERLAAANAIPPEPQPEPRSVIEPSPPAPSLGHGDVQRMACGGMLSWGFSSVLTPQYVDNIRPASTGPLQAAQANWRSSITPTDPDFNRAASTVGSTRRRRPPGGSSTPGPTRPASSASSAADNTPMGAWARSMERDRAQFAKNKEKQARQRFDAEKEKAVRVAERHNAHRAKHERILNGRAMDLRGQPIKGRDWRTREVWDDEVLRLQQPGKCLLTPPVGTYSPCDKIASNKAVSKGCSFGKAKRFDAMRRKLKRDQEMPGPADLIIDRGLAYVGQSLSRGGNISSSFINDDTHVTYAEDIANCRNVRPGVYGLKSPAPDLYQDTDFTTRTTEAVKYQPAKVHQKFPLSSGKSTIEWIQHYAAQVPGPSDFHINRDIINRGVERCRGTKHGYKIFAPHSDPKRKSLQIAHNTHDYTINQEIFKTRSNPGPGSYSHPHGKFGGPGRQIGDVPTKLINVAERHTVTEFAETESYAMQLIHPDKAKSSKPAVGEYFRTVAPDQKRELAKVAKQFVTQQ